MVTLKEWVKNIEKLSKYAGLRASGTLKSDSANSFSELRRKTGLQTIEICELFLTDGIRTKEDVGADFQTFLKRTELILRQEKENIRRIGRAVFQDYDPDEALDILVNKIQPRIWYQAYGPYWVSCCREDHGKTVSDLLPGMEWDPKTGLWIKSENGIRSWTVMLPPTMELLEKEYRKWQSEG